MPENAVTRVTAAYDSTGNYYPEGRFMDRMVPLPGEHLFRLTYRLQKSPERYPWRESDADIIAEGKAGSEGSLPTASLTDAGRKLGLESIVFQPPKENDEPMYSKEPWTFMFTVYGRDNTKTVLDQMHACIFTDAGSVQKEIKGPQVGTFTLRIFMPVRKYDLDYHWLGTLKPGEAFRVGLIKKKFTEFEFIVDLDKAK